MLKNKFRYASSNLTWRIKTLCNIYHFFICSITDRQDKNILPKGILKSQKFLTFVTTGRGTFVSDKIKMQLGWKHQFLKNGLKGFDFLTICLNRFNPTLAGSKRRGRFVTDKIKTPSNGPSINSVTPLREKGETNITFLFLESLGHRRANICN